MKIKSPFFNRSNLRDIIIIVAAISAMINHIDDTKIVIALFLLAFGCFLHFVTKGVLIRNITVCKDGIYSIVRHPYYTANYLIDSCFCLLSGNVYLVWIYPVLFFLTYGTTIRNEEKYLTSTNGNQYYEYMANTPQVFPDKTSTRLWKTLFRGFSLQRITLNETSRMLRFWAVALFIILLRNIELRSIIKFHVSFDHSYFSSLFDDPNRLLLVLLIFTIYTISVFIKPRNNKKPIGSGALTDKSI